ncbi:Rab-GTPase-TBC domain containing protein, putative [Hepatocystis sp. ex Piliocolobus tephrosceles]|nr:Rab-GTPase-TBC domain containing protein, putative [Hepatocystis sp. ex Piliocolobus tephrosceles]
MQDSKLKKISLKLKETKTDKNSSNNNNKNEAEESDKTEDGNQFELKQEKNSKNSLILNNNKKTKINKEEKDKRVKCISNIYTDNVYTNNIHNKNVYNNNVYNDIIYNNNSNNSNNSNDDNKTILYNGLNQTKKNNNKQINPNKLKNTLHTNKNNTELINLKRNNNNRSNENNIFNVTIKHENLWSNTKEKDICNYHLEEKPNEKEKVKEKKKPNEKEKPNEKKKPNEKEKVKEKKKPNEKEDEEEVTYLTYCDDGYLRGMLKNATISPSLHFFLGTKVISFLNEKERDIFSLTCKLMYFEVYSLNNLKSLYKNKFISNEKRPFLWKNILLAENKYISIDLYKELKKQNSSFQKIIEKDIYRTFPNNSIFLNKETDMYKKLSDVLKICSIYFKKIGYCQGMNYVAAIFLLVFRNKIDTVRCFIALLRNFNLKEMFIYKFPELKNIIYQLKVLIKAYLPDLSVYLKKNKIKVDFFCINWFMTLFSQDLSFENTVKLWDMFFLFGIKILIKLSLILLSHYAHKIILLPYDEALTFLKKITKLPFMNFLFNEHTFFSHLKKFKVTNRILQQIIILKKNKEKVQIQVKKRNDGKLICFVMTNVGIKTDESEKNNFLFDCSPLNSFQHNGLQNPGLQKPGLQKPGLQQPGLQQPGLQKPGLQKPGLQKPGLQKPGLQNLTLKTNEWSKSDTFFSKFVDMFKNNNYNSSNNKEFDENNQSNNISINNRNITIYNNVSNNINYNGLNNIKIISPFDNFFFSNKLHIHNSPSPFKINNGLLYNKYMNVKQDTVKTGTYNINKNINDKNINDKNINDKNINDKNINDKKEKSLLIKNVSKKHIEANVYYDFNFTK